MQIIIDSNELPEDVFNSIQQLIFHNKYSNNGKIKKINIKLPYDLIIQKALGYLDRYEGFRLDSNYHKQQYKRALVYYCLIKYCCLKNKDTAELQFCSRYTLYWHHNKALNYKDTIPTFRTAFIQLTNIMENEQSKMS